MNVSNTPTEGIERGCRVGIVLCSRVKDAFVRVQQTDCGGNADNIVNCRLFVEDGSW